mmetsp:Transcript_5176/g.11522  ORF Transcript_5176/g.11522 Transcript_5176/m.11522 type:complete len:134 (+) Transcript_5176:217-618(+)
MAGAQAEVVLGGWAMELVEALVLGNCGRPVGWRPAVLPVQVLQQLEEKPAVHGATPTYSALDPRSQCLNPSLHPYWQLGSSLLAVQLPWGFWRFLKFVPQTRQAQWMGQAVEQLSLQEPVAVDAAAVAAALAV